MAGCSGAKVGFYVNSDDGATRAGQAETDDQGRRYCSRVCLTMKHDSDAGIITCEAGAGRGIGNEGGGARLRRFSGGVACHRSKVCVARGLVIDGLRNAASRTIKPDL